MSSTDSNLLDLDVPGPVRAPPAGFVIQLAVRINGRGSGSWIQ